MSERLRLPTPSEEARRALRWGYRDALGECGEAIISLGVSISEAACRGTDSLIALHVRQARLVLLEAIDAIKHLDALNAEESEASP